MNKINKFVSGEIKDVKSLLQRVEEVTKQKELDLSSGEDLSIGVMNLISIEEHLFYTSQKTKDMKYLDLLNEIRKMRVMEVGTKELKKGNKDKAWNLFDKSYKLYSLFWGLNLGVVGTKDVKQDKNDEVKFIDEKLQEKGNESVFSKLGSLVQKAVDCCRE